MTNAFDLILLATATVGAPHPQSSGQGTNAPLTMMAHAIAAAGWLDVYVNNARDIDFPAVRRDVDPTPFRHQTFSPNRDGAKAAQPCSLFWEDHSP